VANIVRDSRILETAREEAEAWLARDPDLAAPASRRLRAVLEDRWAGRDDADWRSRIVDCKL
jgi:hypothetical protein